MSPELPFDAYGRYYDLLYRDKDSAAEAAYVCGVLERQGIVEGSLLELGSGTGRHGRLLAGRGYRVQGIERSPRMMAAAATGGGFACQLGDARSVRMGCRFDAVLSLFHVLSYQTSNEDLGAVFATAAAHLEAGGVFVFDAWYSPAVLAQRPSVRVKRMADEETEILRIAEPTMLPNENRVDVHYTMVVRDRRHGSVQLLEETHPMRHFSLPEIDWLAAAHGFRRVAAEEFLSGRVPGEDTWGVCFVLSNR